VPLTVYEDKHSDLVIESEADHYTLRFFDAGVRIASVQIVGVNLNSCHIKDFSMLGDKPLTPSLIKLLLKYLKEECGYEKISFERKKDKIVIKEFKLKEFKL